MSNPAALTERLLATLRLRRVASARDAATAVAVAPTLDARSQVSPSVRVMRTLLLCGLR